MNTSRRSPHREFLEASGIACLPGSYKQDIKEKRVTHSSLATHKKTYESHIPIKPDNALKSSTDQHVN
jgi:hypothetical protein